MSINYRCFPLPFYHVVSLGNFFFFKLTESEQNELMQIIKRHRSEQQQVLRACIVWAAAQGHSNAQIARDLAINVAQ